jgi:hypothetical protein
VMRSNLLGHDGTGKKLLQGRCNNVPNRGRPTNLRLSF